MLREGVGPREQGNASYFQPSNNEASGDFGLELEDLFTIHIMESEKGGALMLSA